MKHENVDHLKSLYAAVEAENHTEVDNIARLLYPNSEGFRPTKNHVRITNAFAGNAEEMRLLHEEWLAKMPVQTTDLRPEYCGAHGFLVKINWLHMEWKDSYAGSLPDQYSYRAYNHILARAWLLASLKALITTIEHALDQKLSTEEL